MGYLRRQLVTAALTANAVRPLGGRYASIPAFFAGWLASELAPQLLVASAVDTAAELSVRRGTGPATPGELGLALAARRAAGLGYLIVNASRSATHVETHAARRRWAPTTSRRSRSRPASEDLKTPLRELARPFKMAGPTSR